MLLLITGPVLLLGVTLVTGAPFSPPVNPDGSPDSMDKKVGAITDMWNKMLQDKGDKLVFTTKISVNFTGLKNVKSFDGQIQVSLTNIADMMPVIPTAVSNEMQYKTVFSIATVEIGPSEQDYGILSLYEKKYGALFYMKGESFKLEMSIPVSCMDGAYQISSAPGPISCSACSLKTTKIQLIEHTGGNGELTEHEVKLWNTLEKEVRNSLFLSTMSDQIQKSIGQFLLDDFQKRYHGQSCSIDEVKKC